MSSSWFELAIAILATWRLAHLVSREDGPWDVVLVLRKHAGDSMIGRLMDCPYCASIWLAAPMALLVAGRVPVRVLSWLAISGGACLIERWWETRPVGAGIAHESAGATDV